MRLIQIDIYVKRIKCDESQFRKRFYKLRRRNEFVHHGGMSTKSNNS